MPLRGTLRQHPGTVEGSRKAQGAVLVLLATLAVAGCSSDDDGGESVRAAATASDVASAPAGSDQEAIEQTIKAFYVASAEGDGITACEQFSESGRAGFMRGARKAFPGAITATTECDIAIKLFQVSLEGMIDSLKGKGLAVGVSAIKKLRVERIEVSGRRATALAPVGIELVVQPKRMQLEKVAGAWRIAGSRNLKGARKDS
jgi:hypothetical protein